MRVSPRRLLQEDFKDQPWISRLLSPLNEFIGQVTSALSSNITIQDNLRAEIKELEVRTTDVPIKVRCKFPERPKAILVGYVEEVSASPSVLTAPVWVHWTWDNQVVTIQSVTNIASNTKYRINLVVHYA